MRSCADWPWLIPVVRSCGNGLVLPQVVWCLGDVAFWRNRDTGIIAVDHGVEAHGWRAIRRGPAVNAARTSEDHQGDLWRVAAFPVYVATASLAW